METTILSLQDADLEQYMKNKLAEMLREEEIKWYQRAKVKKLLKPSTSNWLPTENIGKRRIY